MRISKLLSIACMAAVCAGIVSVRADDNPAQAAARAALMEKMNELDAPLAQQQSQTPPPAVTEQQTVTATNAAAAEPAPIVVTTNGAAAEEPAPSMTNSTPIAEPVPETIPAVTNEVEAPPAPMTNTTEVPSEPPMTNAIPMPETPVPEPMPETPAMTNAPEIMPAVTNSVAMPEPAPEPISAMTNTATTTTDSSSLHNVQPDAVGITQPKEKPVKVKPAEPVKAPLPMKNPAFQTIQAPPLPISASKQAQLDALLQKYKADQVTPVEYQAERAKILGEP